MPDGIPSPSPDFPQQIKNVTGNSNVKIQNKNLAWNGWAQDFVSRINNSNIARIEAYDDRNCLFYNANAGYQEYDTKYMFKTNFKDNTAYTFSFDINPLQEKGNICIAYTDGTTLEPDNLNISSWNKVVLSSNPNKTVKYLRVSYRERSCRIDLDTFMVLQGAYTAETIPSYVPHAEQNLPFTFAEGQKGMQGTTLEDDGIHNTRFKEELNTSSTITKVESALAPLGFYFTIAISRLANYQSDSIVGNLISNRFKKVNNSANLLDKGCMSMSSLANKLSFCVDETITTVEGVQTWLQNNSTIVEYDLAEPEIIPYNSTQQSQYNAIKQAKSYDDQTNISSTSTELGFKMDVESLRKIDN